jgi:hypothetical protein
MNNNIWSSEEKVLPCPFYTVIVSYNAETAYASGILYGSAARYATHCNINASSGLLQCLCLYTVLISGCLGPLNIFDLIHTSWQLIHKC